MNGSVALSYAVAVAATLLLLGYVGRHYPHAPRRLPLQMRLDGTPSRATVGRWFLWFPPAIVAWVVAMLGIGFALSPLRPADRAAMVLVNLVIAYVAWLTSWVLDRQIAVARNPAQRFARIDTLWAVFPLLVMIALTLAIAPKG